MQIRSLFFPRFIVYYIEKGILISYNFLTLDKRGNNNGRIKTDQRR